MHLAATYLRRFFARIVSRRITRQNYLDRLSLSAQELCATCAFRRAGGAAQDEVFWVVNGFKEGS